MQFPQYFCFSLIVVFAHGISSTEGNNDGNVTVVKDVRTLHPNENGEFGYELQLSDGTSVKQVGKIEMEEGHPNSSSGEEDQDLVVRGQYSFVDPTGMVHSVSYVADKNGFRPIVDGEAVIHSNQSEPVSTSTASSTTDVTTGTISSNFSKEHDGTNGTVFNETTTTATPAANELPPLNKISSSLFSSPERR